MKKQLDLDNMEANKVSGWRAILATWETPRWRKVAVEQPEADYINDLKERIKHECQT